MTICVLANIDSIVLETMRRCLHKQLVIPIMDTNDTIDEVWSAESLLSDNGSGSKKRGQGS